MKHLKCLTFIHCLWLCSLASLSPMIKAQVLAKKRVHHKAITRGPASYIPQDDVEPPPSELDSWANHIFVHDSAGVLENVRATFASWRDREDYARQWNLMSTGNYEVPDSNFRRAFFQRQLLRYMDKRVTGGIKAAKKDSTLHKIAKVQNSLRPSTEASISKNIKVKFKARVLRGRLIMRVDNPWVDYRTEFSLTGNVNMWVHRKIEWADLTTRFNYQPLEGSYVADFDRPLMENVVARYSFRQPAGSSQTENVFHLLYNRGF